MNQSIWQIPTENQQMIKKMYIFLLAVRTLKSWNNWHVIWQFGGHNGIFCPDQLNMSHICEICIILATDLRDWELARSPQ